MLFGQFILLKLLRLTHPSYPFISKKPVIWAIHLAGRNYFDVFV